MLFNTAQFAFFFLVVAGLHAILPKAWRNAWLLAASIVFYALWIPVYLLLFLAVMAVNYAFAVAIVRGGSRRASLAASIVLTLAVLAYFKYRVFFAQSLAYVTGATVEPVELFLPLGISFYCFVLIALNVDLYRRSMPLPPFSRYVLFVMFFPHLIAGPILRGPELLPQLDEGGTYTSDRTRRGLWLVATGLVKKVVFGDFLLAPFVDSVFEYPGTASAPVHLVAIYSLAFQIYFDFSGYSDIARGLACLLGYELPLNFAEPYLSRNPAEFWRRWHMTLSRWLRDYLYIPLGGNRSGAVRTSINLLATMVLGGLWHGANWTFLIWGALHGLLLVVHRAFSGADRRDGPVSLRDLPAIVLTFHAVCALWVFFRAPDVESAGRILGALATSQWSVEWPVLQMAVVAICVGAHVLERRIVERSDELVGTTRRSWRFAAAEGLALGLAVALTVLCNGSGATFIYFQF